VLKDKLKTISCIFFLTLIFGCAHVPFNTTTLINSQPIARQHKGIYFVVFDERDDRIKMERSFSYIHPLSHDPDIIFWGDKFFDKPLSSVFHDMLIRRFGNDPKGYKTEVKLKAYNPSWYMYRALAVIYKSEFRATLTAEIALLDEENKYVFQKLYTAEFKEIPKSESIIRDVMLDALVKSFNKFADEFEIDLSRIRMMK
jgi:hypothetical protein